MALAGPLAAAGHRPHLGLASGRRPRGALASPRSALRAPGLPRPPRACAAPTPRAAPRPRQFAGELAATARSVRMIARRGPGLRPRALQQPVGPSRLRPGRSRWRGGPSVLELYDLVRPGLGRQVLTAAAALSTTAIAISQAVADCIGPRGRRPRPHRAAVGRPRPVRARAGPARGAQPPHLRRARPAGGDRGSHRPREGRGRARPGHGPARAARRPAPTWSWWAAAGSPPTAIPSGCGPRPSGSSATGSASSVAPTTSPARCGRSTSS